MAASFVVYSHSFALAGLTEPHIGNISLGGFGVWIFFILSGYLISASWRQYPRFNVFFAKRALRIFPGLIVALLFSVVICGIFYSSLSIFRFFTHPDTVSYFNNILLINTQYSLPGTFSSNTYPNAVNGSLWTLAYEFSMYVAVAVLGVLGLLKKMNIARIWGVLFLLQLMMTFTNKQVFSISLFYLQFNLFVMLGLMFFTGVLVNQYYKKLKIDLRLGLLSLVAFFVSATLLPNLSPLFACTLLAYALFTLGSSDKMSWFGKKGDMSYGIYIYSFPIQQMIVSSTGTTNPYTLFLIAYPITLVASYASWHLVESKALRLKTKINLKRYPLTQEESAW